MSSSPPSQSPTSSPSPNPGSFSSTLNGQPTSSTGKASSSGHNEDHVRATEIGHEVKSVEPTTQSRGKQRHSMRSSGGFLLNRKIQSRNHTPPNGDVTVNSDQNGKNKEVDITDGGEEKQGTGRRKHIGKSPLSYELGSLGGSRPKDDSLDNASSSHSTSTRGSSTEGHSSVSEAFDGDPAQIISLALNLSENRRRHMSTGRMSSLETAASRRMVTTPHMSTDLSPAGVGSLKHHLSQQRRASRNISPKPERTPSAARRSPLPTLPFQAAPIFPAQLLPGVEVNGLVDPTFSPSDATLIRAERARVTLELSYEYRRLLQYLPALPLCSDCRPSTRLSTANGRAQPLGRIYNPLQYIRNRKVRVRERHALDSEADGWKDVENVRAWVDLVADERKDKVSKIDDQYPLPTFVGQLDAGDTQQSSVLEKGSNAQKSPAKKVTRPRTDWITSPWDLLGDQYWLDQDSNKFVIEDRYRHKIFGSTPAAKKLPMPATRRSESRSRFSMAPERQNTSESLKQDVSPRERGRYSHYRQNSSQDLRGNNSSRERKSKWPRKLRRSNSSSSSDETDKEGRSGLRGQDFRTQETRLLDRQIMDLVAEDGGDWKWNDINDFEDGNTTDAKSAASAFSSRHPSVRDPDEQALKEVKRANKAHSNPKTTGHLDAVNDFSSHSRLGVSHDNPTSPAERDIPSIEIDRASLAEQFEAPQEDRSSPDASILSEMVKDREQIQGIDFASEKSRNGKRFKQSRDPFGNSLKFHFHGDSLAPNMDHASLEHRRRKEAKSRRSKDGKDPESRLRGLLKGARLADIVSTPVNKVGDYIWRKDGPEQFETDGSASMPSNYNSAAETDDEGHRSRFSRLHKPRSMLSRNNSYRTSGYHMDNLPVFKSPFAKDDEKVDTKDQDHISQQQSAVRQQKSERFERLAPPALDMRSISPSPPSSPERNKTRDYMSDDSRRESAGVDRRFAVVEGSPDPHGKRVPVTGRGGKADATDFQDENGYMNLDIMPKTGKVTGADIVRVKAVIASTGIKARTIIRQSTSVPDKPHPVLEQLIKGSDTDIGPVTRAQGPVIIAGLLVQRLDEQNAALLSAVETFSNKTLPGLHEQLRELDEFITNKLTGMVRQAADDADDLSANLATECTLEVKRLSENIDLVSRRRRRRLRWIRRGGYLALEWMLLALMWFVWLAVVIFRLVRGMVGGVFRGVKWLLWLS